MQRDPGTNPSRGQSASVVHAAQVLEFDPQKAAPRVER
jgi:hypothetical protein